FLTAPARRRPLSNFDRVRSTNSKATWKHGSPQETERRWRDKTTLPQTRRDHATASPAGGFRTTAAVRVEPGAWDHLGWNGRRWALRSRPSRSQQGEGSRARGRTPS